MRARRSTRSPKTLGPSFPSGHSSTAASFYAALALIMARGRSARARALLAGTAGGIAAAVAASRVLLDVHWVSDVVAGVMLGWAWFALCAIAFGGRPRALRRADGAARRGATGRAGLRAAGRGVGIGRPRGSCVAMSAHTVPGAARAFTETPLFAGLARAGYARAGSIYSLIGLLAVRLADGAGGDARPSQQGAMQKIAAPAVRPCAPDRDRRSASAATRSGASRRRSSARTPEYGKHSAMDRIGAAGSGARLRRVLRPRDLGPAGHRRQFLREDEAHDRRRAATGPAAASSSPPSASSSWASPRTRPTWA